MKKKSQNDNKRLVLRKKKSPLLLFHEQHVVKISFVVFQREILTPVFLDAKFTDHVRNTKTIAE